MILTKALRAYCEQNRGSILNAKQLFEDYFPMAEYKTFLRTLNRLRDEGILTPVSKGVYLISNESEQVDSDAAILHDYASETYGMVAGKQMFYEAGLLEEKPETIEIYTRRISSGKRNIGKFSIHGSTIFFNENTKKLIQVLEVLENISSFKKEDYMKVMNFVEERIPSYSPLDFRQIVSNIHYQYATIATLSQFIKENRIDDNMCVELYKAYDKSNSKLD